MYSLIALFFSVPLYFLVTPVYQGAFIIGESYSFERQKVILFCILLFIAICETLFRSRRDLIEVLKKYGSHILILMGLPWFSNFVFSHPFDTLWLLGGYEKYHGYLYYIALIVFAILIASSLVYIRRYVVASILAGGIVSLIALGECLGGGFDIYSGTTIHDTYGERSLGTLGNPNYLAGYLLGLIPLTISYIGGFRRWSLYGTGIIAVLIMGLLTTGSYSAILLFLGAGVYYLLRILLIQNRKLFGFGGKEIIFAGILVIIVFFAYLILDFIDHDKWLSLMSRGVLIYASIQWIFSIPFAWIFGLGPDAVLFFFSPDRSPLMDQYFPADILIDSSHNILLDILYQFGIIPIVYIGFVLRGLYRSLRQTIFDPSGISACMSIVLLLGFLLLNVAVVSHMILLVLAYFWSGSLQIDRDKKS